MAMAPGMQVDRHVVVRQLGVGGMAEVWLVRHSVLGSLHALKVPIGLAAAQHDRVLREGRAQAALDHPNILPVRDVLSLDGTLALLLPYVPGPSLHELIDARPPTVSEALGLLHGIARGLAFAHDHGVVHRDLKPANVLLHLRADRLVPRIADFGLVLRVGDGDADDTAYGTPAYAAPEQVVAPHEVDARADLYSFGVLAAELLTGRRPRTPRDVDDVPETLRGLVSALLAAAPEHRPDSAHDVAALLEGLGADDLGPDTALARWVAAHESPEADRGAPRPPEVGNLPSDEGGLVGRDDAVADVMARIREHRLVTLVGHGGIGKTQLALATARALQDAYPGGVWLCHAERTTTPSELARAMGAVLHVEPGADATGRVAGALWGRGPALFLIDNVEQVERISDALEHWLEQAPEARFLVTSRAPTRAAGEHVVPVQPLGADASEALFVRRARDAHPPATVAPDDPALGPLLTRLDGVPLALELAAAQVGLHGLRALTDRLDRDLDVLRTRMPGVPARQQTLRAALLGSWVRLNAAEQAVMAQAVGFSGPFTVAAAEAIMDVPGWVDDALLGCVDQGLLVLHSGDRPRFALRPLVRTFLAEQGSPSDAWRRRHRAWFARLAEPTMADMADLRAAAESAIADRDPTAAGLARAAWRLLEDRGPFEAGARLLERAIAVVGTDPDLRSLAAQAQLAAGDLTAARHHLDRLAQEGPSSELEVLRGDVARHEGDLVRARQAYEAARAEADTPRARGRAATGLGNVLVGLGQLDLAERAYAEAAEQFEGTGDDRRLAGVAANRGALALHRGDLAAAERWMTQAIEADAAHERPHRRALVEANRATVYKRRGQLGRARGAYLSAATALKRQGDRRHLAAVSVNLANVSTDLGEVAVAQRALDEAEAGFAAIDDRFGSALVMGNVGILRELTGDLPGARDALEQAAHTHTELGFQGEAAAWWLHLVRVYGALGEVERARERGEAALNAARERGDHATRARVLAHMAAALDDPRLAEAALATEGAEDSVVALATHTLARQCVAADPEGARRYLERGEPALRALADRLARIERLLDRAWVLSELGQIDAAESAVIEAEALHRTTELGPDAPLTERLRAAHS